MLLQIVVNAALVLKSVEQNNGYSPTLLFAAGLQIWYALDFLWFEDGFPTSFDVMYEGTGYMLTLAYDIYPFIPTTITRFLLVYRFVVTLFYLCRRIISLVVVALLSTLVCKTSPHLIWRAVLMLLIAA
jgi:hypothetical protein